VEHVLLVDRVENAVDLVAAEALLVMAVVIVVAIATSSRKQKLMRASSLAFFL
jgi:hypothetical protein